MPTINFSLSLTLFPASLDGLMLLSQPQQMTQSSKKKITMKKYDMIGRYDEGEKENVRISENIKRFATSTMTKVHSME